ncbi:MAG: Gfo/Idh/MocA family oxidoreductase [Herbiconiux sp.]|uniref:Gfo/Idh/MocA family protein n=1 Tax=Herbiconiux sp. TaxID=1871186 RepID=UPI001205AA72|nr:Gfo/Idh/MocA family oxidoreductase [Herbiconiux sp.]TAJ48155.1 MAG: Gfo/Idh/MocA family oxidoreductase [Herbiconiux sp.]
MAGSAGGRVRWAVVGTGGISRRTVRDLIASGDADVVAVASRTQETADAFAAEFGLAAAFGSLADLCASDAVDAVYIGTPHSTHFAYAKTALEAGKHVLCEKPLTMTADEAIELGEIARRHDVFLMEAMWMKFGPGVQRSLELIASGVIGEPRFLQAGLGYPVPEDGPPRFWDAALGGGALYDMGVYTVALAQLLFGTPTSITAGGAMRPDGVDLHESYQLEFASGASAQLVTSITFLVPPRGWIGGTRGSITLDEPLFSPRSIRVTTGRPPAPPEVETIEFPPEDVGYLPMFRAVNAAILAGEREHPTHPLSATVDVLRTLEQIRSLLASAPSTKG